MAFLALRALAADPPPLVSILATDPRAAEEGNDPGSFTVIRNGPAGEALTVRYRVGGTAESGTDYRALTGQVTIPADGFRAAIAVLPFDDNLAEPNETVVVALEQPPDWPAPYIVCWPSVAVVTIEDNDSNANLPPRVALVNPPDGAVFVGPVDVALVARASDPDGRIRTVEFFDGDKSLGTVTNWPWMPEPVLLEGSSLDLNGESLPEIYPDPEVDWTDLTVAPDLDRLPGNTFRLMWLDAPPGAHSLTAVATDNRGASTVSAPVHIRVTEPPLQPVVDIVAVDPVATEPTPDGGRLDTALFQVHRSGGDLTLPLPVFYHVEGTASNGVDYKEIPNMVVIPAGWRSADIAIEPLDDNLVEGDESVRLVLAAPVCIEIFPPPPDCYLVGRQNEARAVIRDNDSEPANLPPVVRLVRPQDGDVFLAPANIHLVAEAQDPDGRVVTVEFFEGHNSLGTVTNNPLVLGPNIPPFALTWSNVPPGRYVLTAEATDNLGATSLSRPVEVKVVDRGPPPVVTVKTTDGEASEGGAVVNSSGEPKANPAVFTFARTGGTDRALDVYYHLSGSASNGLDYRLLSGHVTIPVGAATADVTVIPIDDELCEGTETVGIQVQPPVCIDIFPPPPDCYVVGDPARASAVILDNEVCPTNQPPKVAIVRPENEMTFLAPADILIAAEAKDPDGRVVAVQFFAGDHRLGIVSNSVPGQDTFQLTWPNVGPGSYVLTAAAVDNEGAGSVSDPVRIRVIDSVDLPVVTIEATDPTATEGPIQIGPGDAGSLGTVQLADGSNSGPIILDTATLTVRRGGRTNDALTVFYRLGGTAENGVDYVRLPGEVTIPPGQSAARIEIFPIEDRLVEGTETVVAELIPVPCAPVLPPPPGCYLVGSPDRAVAFIQDNEPKNDPPKVAITSPPSGSVFLAPVDIRLIAAATDGDGWVRTVEFFAEGRSLGVVTNHPWILDPIRLEANVTVAGANAGDVLFPSPIDPVIVPINPFFLVWSNVPPGDHVLTAVATDNLGASSTSEPVKIEVIEGPVEPIVTVVARDPVASEGCPDPNADCLDTATFVVRRSGGTETPLRVFYRWSGTASNGVDYAELPNSVVIEPGQSAASIVVTPIDDSAVEGPESVILSLLEPPCLVAEPADVATADGPISLGCYQVGRAHTARAVILDNDTPANQPPVVRMIQPDNGEIFRAPADVTLAAAALDLDGRVVQVEFFEGDHSLGVVTGPTIVPMPLDASVDPSVRPLQPVYELTWTNVPAGAYVLTAVATDEGGAKGISEPVEIKVVSADHPPVVNIEAADPVATEQSPLVDALPDTATFVVNRSGDPSRPLVVSYRVGGTAENGIDYQLLTGRVTIEAGESSARIVVDPIDDLICEGTESVRIGLVPHACLTDFPPPRDCYLVGPKNRARAVIHDDDVCPSNQPPKVALVRPGEGDVFQAPADVLVCAEARDADGRVVRVEFFANATSIGAVALNTDAEPELFCVRWADVPAGTYALTAVATDNDGASTRSEPVRVRVLERPVQPVVTLQTLDPVASEDGMAGAFVVSRNCCTNLALSVRYGLSGTAENGADYRQLSGEVTIPAGAYRARIVVEPIDDDLMEGTETVVAQVLPPICLAVLVPSPSCYLVGHPARDVVFIQDNDSEPNRPPLISIVSPASGSAFKAPADIPIAAEGLDPDGYIPHVEFFAGTNKIGEVNIDFFVLPPPGQRQTFEFDWNQVPPGRYRLTARATDDRGARTVSDPVEIQVVAIDTISVVSIDTVDALAREGTTNTAVFRVSRLGNTNDELNVRFEIGGRAENGVDYKRIPNSVVLAAGVRSVRIVIEAIEDDLPEGMESVVLRLLPADSTSTTPPYAIGRPATAAALIVDPGVERPPCRRLDDGMFHVCLPADNGTGYRLMSSTNLVDWEEICTGVVVDGAIHFVDPDAALHGMRFYRAFPMAAPVDGN
jgi:Calx-beta domain/Bacterial Ig domain